MNTCKQCIFFYLCMSRSSHLARLNGPFSGGLYGPYVARLAAKQQTDVAPLCRYIIAHGPSMTRLLDAARAIFGPPGIFK